VYFRGSWPISTTGRPIAAEGYHPRDRSWSPHAIPTKRPPGMRV
jgi:hypothetical protein